MRRPLPSVAAAVLVLAALPTRAWSQAPARPMAIVASGGAALPSGAFGDDHTVGVHGAVSLLIRLAGEGLRLRPELGVGRFGLKDGVGTVVPLAMSPAAAAMSRTAGARVVPGDGSDAVGASTLLSLLANLELPLARGAYLVGGVGATRINTLAASRDRDVNQTALAYNGGAGVRFRVGRVEAFVEARLHALSLDEERVAFSGVRTIPLAIGVVF